MTDDVEEFLAHFGVKGMKWGRRKEGSVSTVEYSQEERFRDKGEGEVHAKLVSQGINKGLSVSDSRDRAHAIVKKANEYSNLRSVGNSASASVASYALTNASLRAMRNVVYSRNTEKILSNIFGNSSYSTQVTVTNALIGARQLSQLANDPNVRRGISAIAGVKGLKKGWELTESGNLKRAAKIVDKNPS